ncbi:MAG: hypothetical protein JW995_12980 [Melioribacteraceae bacterium]|nr:hypothetical protein [Melioribacteraceae bacterium]
MELKKSFMILILILLSFSLLIAQGKKKSRGWDDWDDDFFEWYGESRPMIEFNYGTGILIHKSYEDSFADIGSIELKLGYSEIDSDYDDLILDLDSRYIFGSKISNTLRSENSPGEHQFASELYRFGFGNRKGYGFKIGPVAFIPYNQTAVQWSKFNRLEPVNTNSPASLIKGPQKIADYYGNSIRFGSLSEVGAKLEIASMIAFNLSYEGSVIYPRVLFWKWLGSFAIEHSGYHALGEFIEEIMDRVPAAGPIMNVALRGAYQYVFFLLKKDNMNWPFDTAKPLAYEQFKLGITLTF